MTVAAHIAHTVADVMMIPFAVLSGVAAGVAVSSWIQRDHKPVNGHRLDPASFHYSAASARITYCVRFILVGWIIYIALSAWPAPDYIVKKVVIDRPVHGIYDDAMDDCMGRFNSSDRTTKSINTMCHQRALLAINPDLKVISRPVIRYRDRVRRHPYKALFDNCVAKFEVAKTNEQRIDKCHKIAAEASED